VVEARGQGPWSRPLLEPGGRTRRLMPVVEALAFIPRHPANSHGTILGNDRRITPPGSSRRQIRSKPWTYLPLESTRAQPSSQPGDRPGGWTRGIDPGLTRLRRELQMCRLPSVSLRARSGGASLRSAPPPTRFAASGSDLRVLRGALRRCARYGLRVAATLSARAPTRATRRFAPRHAPSPSARFPSRREAAFGSLLFRFMEVFRQVVPRVHARGSGGVWPAVSPTPRGSDPSALRFATHLLSRFR
jgi:hypothetical protein